MAGKFTNEGNALALALALGIGTPSVPANVYLGLATAAIDEDDTLATITECTDATYTREEVTYDTPSEVSDKMRAASTGDVTFGAFTTGGTEITYGFLTDASSGTSGTLIAYFPLASSKFTNAGETLVVSSGTATVDFD